MADKVDMSLDDIIKMNKINKRPQFKRKNTAAIRSTTNQRQRTGGAGPRTGRKTTTVRNSNPRSVRRAEPFRRPNQTKTGNQWKHDLFDGNTTKPARLMIGNLHFRVSDNDIKELFKEFGQIKKAAVHYDKSGRSLGNAEVVFANKISARKAMNKYNDVLLDGRKMKITLVTDKPISSRVSILPKKNGFLAKNGLTIKKNRALLADRSQNSNRRPKPKVTPKSREQLDAELDAYLNKN